MQDVNESFIGAHCLWRKRIHCIDIQVLRRQQQTTPKQKREVLKRGSQMTKKIGLSLILAAGIAILQPATAFSQDRGYRDRDFHNHDSRHEERAFRSEERHEFRGPAVRAPEWRTPYTGRSFRDRPYGYVYSAPRYNSYYYEPARPYNCR
jgi:hypothetical protein